MKIADMHCDTISALLKKQRAGLADTLFDNNLHMDLKRMRRTDYLLQNFALFVDQKECGNPYEEAKAEYAVFKEEMEKNEELISQVLSYKDIEANRSAGKLSALLTIEEGEVCQGSVDKLKEFYDLGVRMMTLVWNYDNSLSTSTVHSLPPKPRKYQGDRPGLTETGLEFVQRMEELGMIPDVSHMSDEGIEDMLSVTRKPFVASHSCARALCPHRRNLTDEFIRRMGEKGCVIGVNFYSRFLKDGMDFSKTEWIAEHILHMVHIGGIECVGLGSDFDGIDCGLELENCEGVQQLAECLRKRGMTEGQIEQVFYKNVLRLYEELL